MEETLMNLRLRGSVISTRLALAISCALLPLATQATQATQASDAENIASLDALHLPTLTTR